MTVRNVHYGLTELPHSYGRQALQLASGLRSLFRPEHTNQVVSTGCLRLSISYYCTHPDGLAPEK